MSSFLHKKYWYIWNYIYLDIINTSAEKLFSRQCILEKPGVYPNPSTEEDKNNSHKEEWSNKANIPSPEQDGWGEGEVRDWDELSLPPEQDHFWYRSRACLLEIKEEWGNWVGGKFCYVSPRVGNYSEVPEIYSWEEGTLCWSWSWESGEIEL